MFPERTNSIEQRGKTPKVSCKPGQRRHSAPLLNAEAPETVGASQRCEALVGDAGRARDKLQQAEALLVVETLHSRPEPAHHDVTIVVAWQQSGGVSRRGEEGTERSSGPLAPHLLCTRCCSSSR